MFYFRRRLWRRDGSAAVGGTGEGPPVMRRAWGRLVAPFAPPPTAPPVMRRAWGRMVGPFAPAAITPPTVPVLPVPRARFTLDADVEPTFTPDLED